MFTRRPRDCLPKSFLKLTSETCYFLEEFIYGGVHYLNDAYKGKDPIINKLHDLLTLDSDHQQQVKTCG